MISISNVSENDCEITNYTSVLEDDIIIPAYFLGKKVVKIGKGAFYKCACTGSLVIPDTVETINSFAFSSSMFKGNLTLPKNIKRIEENTFWMCKFTGTLELPDSLEYIGKFAFYGCDFTGSIRIPKNVKIIDTSCFSKCKFDSLIFEEGSVLRIINEWAFADVPLSGKIEFPKSIKLINRRAFLDCDNIDSINVPYDEEVFKNCSKVSVAST